MQFLIIRHGDPDYVHDSLTEKGFREAELLARRLKKEGVDKIYVSPLGRAAATAHRKSAGACAGNPAMAEGISRYAGADGA